MKFWIFLAAGLFGLVATGFSQSNIGFAKAAGLGEGKSVTCEVEALGRFVEAIESPALAPLYAERISLAFQNAGKTYGGARTVSVEDMKTILRWLKSHPADTAEWGVSVYKLPKGTYTFETLTKSATGWGLGRQIARQAHEGEWVFEFWGQKIASTWCLNLFPSVGKVVETPAKQAPQPPQKVGEPEVSAPAPDTIIIRKEVIVVRDTVIVSGDRHNNNEDVLRQWGYVPPQPPPPSPRPVYRGSGGYRISGGYYLGNSWNPQIWQPQPQPPVRMVRVWFGGCRSCR